MTNGFFSQYSLKNVSIEIGCRRYASVSFAYDANADLIGADGGVTAVEDFAAPLVPVFFLLLLLLLEPGAEGVVGAELLVFFDFGSDCVSARFMSAFEMIWLFLSIANAIETDWVIPLGVEFEIYTDSGGNDWRTNNANAWFFRGTDAYAFQRENFVVSELATVCFSFVCVGLVCVTT